MNILVFFYQYTRSAAAQNMAVKYIPVSGGSIVRLKMQQDIRTLKQISCVAMIALCPRQVW